MRTGKCIVTAALVLLSTGCISKNGSATAESANDTAVDTLALPAPQPLTRLPDTMYASADAVKFVVEYVGDSAAGALSSLDDLYTGAPGALTFRQGQSRDASFAGTISGTPSEITVDWEFATAYDTTRTKFGVWGGGSGWTGQPLLVSWPDSIASCFRDSAIVNESFDGKELIVGSLCGNVYFINPETGASTRNPVYAGNPIKGTVSLDPTLNGNLYVGQGIPANKPFGAVVVNLYKDIVTDMFAEDPKAWRGWGAYDSSPVRVGQFLFRPGENGSVYKFNVEQGSLTLHSVLRYRVAGYAPGIEASMAVWRNYGFVCDNHGNIIALNLDNMRPVWRYTLGDDIDSTPVVGVEDGNPYIYTGCEIDRQGSGTARFVKLDALSGEPVWRTEMEGNRADVDGKHFDGGYYATALPGSGNCSHLIYNNCVLNTGSMQNGVFVAFERSTGKIAYTTPLRYYAWSSPVGFLNERGEMFVVTLDAAGRAYLINGADGSIISVKQVGANFESSPVVWDNHVAVGSRGRFIYRMSIK